LILLEAIDRFGVMAIMGRPVLYAGEARTLQTAENIVNGYNNMKNSTNRAEWMENNPVLAAIFYNLELLDAG